MRYANPGEWCASAACMTHDKAGPLRTRKTWKLLGTSSHNDGELIEPKRRTAIEKRDIRHRLRRTRVADCRS